MMAAGSLYFHSPCFDGIVSAVLAWDFLGAHQGWSDPALHAVNYDLRESWLSAPLTQPAAVVDFLYHPDASFWADHHQTAFLTEVVRQHFEARRSPELAYDESSDSCAGLLWEHLFQAFGHRNTNYTELVTWAEKIDAARYASVEEALSSTAPALRLSLGLAMGCAGGYCEGLVRALRQKPLVEVAELSEARDRFEHVRTLTQVGLDRFKRSARLEDDGIVVFDVDATDAIASRYAPYHFFPEARYSVGIVRFADTAKITAMRNPWREFPSVPLGRIASRLGGGGHHRIGSIALRGEAVAQAPRLLSEFLAEIRQRDRQLSTEQP